MLNIRVVPGEEWIEIEEDLMLILELKEIIGIMWIIGDLIIEKIIITKIELEMWIIMFIGIEVNSIIIKLIFVWLLFEIIYYCDLFDLWYFMDLIYM